MHDEVLIKASLVRLLNDEELNKAITAAESGPSAVSPSDRTTGVVAIPPSVEAILKEEMPQELFELTVAPGTVVERLDNFPLVFGLLQEMREVEKAINDRAAALGWAGNPTSAFTYSGAAGTYSYFRHFQNASIYWTLQYGAREVHGAIRDRYFQMGAESSYLGYPQTDELTATTRVNNEEVRYSNFQGGAIFWTATRGAFLIPSFDPITERHQLGAFLHIIGKGFTPNSRVSLWIVNEPNAPQSIGSLYAASDGRFGTDRAARMVVDLRNRGPQFETLTIARAVDEATGQSADHQLSYALSL